MIISVKCYLAKLKTFKRIYPKAHFEIITRTAKSELSPSWKLLNMVKQKTLSFETYKQYLLSEIVKNPKALKRIEELREIAKDKMIFLVCYERNPKECHRSIIKDIIERKIII